MKKLSLFISAFALCSSVSYMAMAAESVNCANLPSCESLGYKDQIKYCPSRYIRCPFSETIGACLHEAAVGSVQYFPFNMDEDAKNRGWLLCDGSEYAIDKYPELYALIGGNFCKTVHGGSCASGKFRVPDYRGYFLRVKSAGSGLVLGAGVDKNISFTTSQNAGLPDVTGSFSMYLPKSSIISDGVTNYYPGETEGAFTRTQLNTPEIANYTLNLSGSTPKQYLHQFNFKLSDPEYLRGSLVAYKTPYGRSADNVIPKNYAVNAYIYTGKIMRTSLTDASSPMDDLYNTEGIFDPSHLTPPTFE